MTPHCPHPTIAAAQRRRGFTLIEVMIVVAIIAILASVALPSYFDYVRRGQLPEAQAAMSDFRVKMEQYYQDNRNYGAAQCADDGPPTLVGRQRHAQLTAGAQFFTYTCALTAGGQGYTVTATGSGARAIGHVYTVDQNNTRGDDEVQGRRRRQGLLAGQGHGMLTRPKRQLRGLTLIELMVTVVILVMLLLGVAPSIGAWMRNTQVRNVASSMLAGLNRARNEAMRRNVPVRFSLVSLADSTVLTAAARCRLRACRGSSACATRQGTARWRRS